MRFFYIYLSLIDKLDFHLYIEKFVNIVGKEGVIAGTDCGFGTFAGFGNVDPDIAYLKLQSLVEGASKVK